jgi:hypothetical protein
MKNGTSTWWKEVTAVPACPPKRETLGSGSVVDHVLYIRCCSQPRATPCGSDERRVCSPPIDASCQMYKCCMSVSGAHQRIGSGSSTSSAPDQNRTAQLQCKLAKHYDKSPSDHLLLLRIHVNSHPVGTEQLTSSVKSRMGFSAMIFCFCVANSTAKH